MCSISILKFIFNTIYKQSFYFDFNLFKHNAQFIKLNYMPSRQYIIMVYKLSRNMVTKLEKHSLIHTSCVGTWFKYKVLLGLIPRRSRILGRFFWDHSSRQMVWTITLVTE